VRTLQAVAAVAVKHELKTCGVFNAEGGEGCIRGTPESEAVGALSDFGRPFRAAQPLFLFLTQPTFLSFRLWDLDYRLRGQCRGVCGQPPPNSGSSTIASGASTVAFMTITIAIGGGIIATEVDDIASGATSEKNRAR
jgi:hypothetical protein